MLVGRLMGNDVVVFGLDLVVLYPCVELIILVVCFAPGDEE